MPAGRSTSACDRALLRGDHEDPVDALDAQALDRVAHRRAVERGQADDGDEVARRVGGLLDREERRRRAVERRVEAHDAERPRPAGDERARRGVRAVVELAHRGEHAPPRLGPDLRAVVDDPRDGLVRDARELGHVGHHGGAPASLPCVAAVPRGRVHAVLAAKAVCPPMSGGDLTAAVSVHTSGRSAAGRRRPRDRGPTTPSAPAWALDFPHNRAGRSRHPPPAVDRLVCRQRLDTENVSVNNARR